MSQIQRVPIMKQNNKQQSRLDIVIGIWNLEGMIPGHNSIKRFMEKIVPNTNQQKPDLICIATQQCQRSINMSFFCQNKQQWENALKQSANGYKMVESATMRALHTAIFVKDSITDCYSTKKKTTIKAGICNIMGNKGAINLVVNLLGQNLQFINCHLQAHQHSNQKRNQVLLKIANTMVQKDFRNQVFICGDFNYRLEMTNEQYHELIAGKPNTDQAINYTNMFEKDQLLNQQILHAKFLPHFKQKKINFPPTYKISQYGPEYNKERVPGWTDRIFHRKGRVEQTSYQCLYGVYGTDHRPVKACFKITILQSNYSNRSQSIYAKKMDKGCSLI